ncbi:hypothetical protein D3C78_1690940 [compost metagenome]
MLVGLLDELQALGIAASPLLDGGLLLGRIGLAGHAVGVRQRRLALLKLGVQRFLLQILIIRIAGRDARLVLAMLILKLGDRLLVASLVWASR